MRNQIQLEKLGRIRFVFVPGRSDLALRVSRFERQFE